MGRRVVVRRLLPGRTGAGGGPAMTDVLGVCEAWADGVCRVRRDDGSVVEIETRLIVSGKPVPPRPAHRTRVEVAEAAGRAADGWPAERDVPLGEWRLRQAGGYSKRANSALAVGDPGLPLAEAVAAVVAHYRAAGLVPRLRVVPGTDVDTHVAAAGWGADPDDFESHLLLAPVPRLLRALPRSPVEVALGPLTDSWLASDQRSRSYGDVARRVLTGGTTVFALVGDGVARGRAVLVDDWVGVSSLWTDPEQRGQRLGSAVLRALLDWGVEQGAGTAWLEVTEENVDVVDWYERLGFVRHHSYRYYVPRDASSAGKGNRRTGCHGPPR